MNIPRRTLRFTVGLFLLGMTFAGWYFATGPENKSKETRLFSRQSVDQETLSRGHRLYDRHCSTCHGSSGRGDGPAAGGLSSPPANFRSDTVVHTPPKELFRTISKGRPKKGMPAWAGILSVQERKAIVHYLRRKIMDRPRGT
jgi:mono/diheme cytochrome c family protein